MKNIKQKNTAELIIYTDSDSDVYYCDKLTVTCLILTYMKRNNNHLNLIKGCTFSPTKIKQPEIV